MATIETERLILRPFSMDDLDAYAALNADPEVMRHFPATMTRDEVATWIEHHEARRAARGGDRSPSSASRTARWSDSAG